eukprot:TRINITY_DN10161_c0_g1_i1.p1 TRINITY_DN10161_c0_g1~~TRINITY_DN10161_c0_g1_i1.p1  ORF type:complete len:211 (-),score=20.66 TRINITY_DN10161_c0_g1_i1:522-1154(-)
MGASTSCGPADPIPVCSPDGKCDRVCRQSVEVICAAPDDPDGFGSSKAIKQVPLAMTNHLLLKAARDSDLDGIEAQLEKGACADTRRPFVMCTESVPCPKMPIMQRATGMTPLMYCAQSGYEEGVIRLLDAGALVNAEDEDGMRPLHFAASSGCHRCCEVLLERGADPAALDDNGRSARSMVPEEDCSTKADQQRWEKVLLPADSPHAAT